MKILPLADMRGISFNRETLVYSSKRHDLCGRCGSYDSCEESSKKMDEDVYVKSECQIFIPILMFVNPKGTDDEFTTIRLGEAWVNRVLPNTEVALFSKKDGYYGKALVTFRYSGTKRNIIFHGINTNHLMLDFKGTPLKKMEALIKIVSNSYGNLIYKNNDYATIIGLRRIS